MKVPLVLLAAVLLGVSVVAATAAGSEPESKLQVLVPDKPVAAGEEIELEVILSTDAEPSHTFLLGPFSQVFGIYVLGPWGVVQPDLSKVRPENWMHQEHSAAARITVAQGKSYRTTVKLSDYFQVSDPNVFKTGEYQVNVKFYEIGWKMSSPIDSGAVRFEIAPKK